VVAPVRVGDEDLFLQDMTFTLDKDEQILEGLLSDANDDLYIQVFYFTDRSGTCSGASSTRGIRSTTRRRRSATPPRCSRRIRGWTRSSARRGRSPPQATLIVCSDHGFTSFRRGLNINTWLARNGYMALKGQTSDPATLEKLFDTRELFQNVDWSRTKAYSLGFGGVYVNLVGRERDGIVLPGAEYEEVRRGIREGLEALVDPVTKERPVARVWTREEMYSAFEPNLIPDLRVGNNLNYRISWQGASRGAPRHPRRQHEALVGGSLLDRPEPRPRHLLLQPEDRPHGSRDGGPSTDRAEGARAQDAARDRREAPVLMRRRALALLAVTGALAAGDPLPPQRLADLRAEIARLKEDARRLEGEEHGLLGEIAAMDRRIALSRAELDEAKTRLSMNEEALAEHERTLAELSASQERRKPYLARSLRALYTRGTVGLVSTLLGSLSGAGGRDGMRYAALLARRDASRIDAWRQAARRLTDERAALDAERQGLSIVRDEAQHAAATLEASRARREDKVARIRGDREQHEKAIAELEAAASGLTRVVPGRREGPPPAGST
jgi:peptidoglycan hydrolase CwlO-like protein